MFSAHISRRLAGVGAAAIVGLGAVLVGGVAPAQAAGVDTSYTCETLNGPSTSAVKVKLSLPETAKAGSTVPSRKFKMEIALPEELVGTLNFFGIKSLSGDVTGLRYKVGKTNVAVTGAKIPVTPVPASGAMTLKLKGTSASFMAPAVGTHAVKVPSQVHDEPQERRRHARHPDLRPRQGVRVEARHAHDDEEPSGSARPATLSPPGA